MDGIEVTQSSKVPDMQIVQHVLSLMESSVAKLQYSDSDLYGLQKLDPRKPLKHVPLASYEYGGKRRRGYGFATNDNDDGADAPDFKANFSLKRAPTVALDKFDGYSNTVLENVVRVLSGQFQYKLRPFIPFFNVDDSWIVPNTQIKLSFDLPQTELSRYLILTDKVHQETFCSIRAFALCNCKFAGWPVYETLRLETSLKLRVFFQGHPISLLSEKRFSPGSERQ